MIEVKRIGADETRALRHAVLRPDKPIDELVYPGDDAGVHFGAMLDDEIVGIATIYREAMPDETNAMRGEKSWRLRGMATAESVRRTGAGKLVLKACIEYIAAQQDELLWCNARINAVEFYTAHGFQIKGELFEMPPIGLHYVMWRAIVARDAKE